MGAKILIIDDSPTIGLTVAWALSSHGYQVEVAKDGLSALSALRRFDPDLVLLDIKLPNLNGFQLCEMLRRKCEYASMPIIMLSGLSSKTDIQRARKAGCDDYLVKPVSDEKLLMAVEQQLVAAAQ